MSLSTSRVAKTIEPLQRLADRLHAKSGWGALDNFRPVFRRYWKAVRKEDEPLYTWWNTANLWGENRRMRASGGKMQSSRSTS